ncbi:MAG: prepilin-type N-terminal cleavage/methylation domain-containing protein [Nevskiales bacterium]
MLNHPGRQGGLTLVELMVAMALGLVLFAGLLNAYVATVKHNGDLIVSAHLDNELHKVLDMMARDLRRAGTHGSPSSLIVGGSNPFAVDAPAAYTGEAANSCITFGYDWDSDGVLDISPANADERYGFRLKDGAIQARLSGLACDADGWSDVTDKKVVRVTALQFQPTNTVAGAMHVQEFQISINAELNNDPAVTRSLSKQVRVRNDLRSP